jgi:hypothetical protein
MINSLFDICICINSNYRMSKSLDKSKFYLGICLEYKDCHHAMKAPGTMAHVALLKSVFSKSCAYCDTPGQAHSLDTWNC